MRRLILAMLLGWGLLALAPAMAQETCSGENCMPQQDEDLTDCKGQDCTLPPPDDQVESCKGEGCKPGPQDSDDN